MSATRAQGFSFNEIHDRGQVGKIARKAFDSIGLVSLSYMYWTISLIHFSIYMLTHLCMNSFVMSY